MSLLKQKTFFRITFTLLFFTGFKNAALAQTLSADSLFSLSRTAAFDQKDYNQAIALAQQALRINPGYAELKIFLARLYTWNKQADSARRLFDEVIGAQPPSEDAFIAYADLEHWEHRDSAALAIADRGLQAFPQSVPLLYRKAQTLFSLRDFKTAGNYVDTILQIDRNHTDARMLANRIRDNVAKNRIGLKYDYVYFDKQFPDPWHLASLEYARQTRSGAFIARVNYANRFQQNGWQLETEAYPLLSRTFYSYLNLAYSDNVGVFPKWKAGASLYANLPRAFEAELGIRYLYFASDNFIYTGYVGKYLSSFLFGFRAYISPQQGKVTQAYSVIGRYYFGGADDYLNLNVGTGISPDNRLVNVQLNTASTSTLLTYRAEAELRFSIRKLNVITLNAMYLNQEYAPGNTGNQIQGGIGYIRRF